ncbi:DNA repair protein RecO [Tropicibacter naphthalenivorans]|uniref:DNA repair protein RecO n=1 Tax=Tropicibacter naphthalenivorans TaxID=441103 RepID=A0A0P1GAG4_9RHOB|nr:DNA repair protein RecO [Tropicibacter naphthalenivorans]CUH78392.1 Recombination protein O [Tropicibacter naphthalenivorans]SMC80138.1 DNA replication and repair protein RecO [Tropicibacter naphthalenivorans]
MDWRDTGILLSTRKHGETSLILEVFTPEHGRHAGIVRGGTSRKLAPHLQPGAQLDLVWKARLEEHIGAFTAEPQRSRAANAMGDRLSLAGLNAVTALLGFCLPEREPHPALYRRSEALLDLLGQTDIWPLAYLQWEVALLAEMGFALDLTRCAATGTTQDLTYVSPKTGRAVSTHGAGEWRDKLLPLPPVLLGQGDASDGEILIALGTTGHFLDHHLAPSLGHTPIPDARGRLLDRLSQRAAQMHGPSSPSPQSGIGNL